jgi:ABC-type hemin transport system ATPase subunit
MLMVSERIVKEEAGKVVRQVGIKTSVSDMFHLNAVLKTAKQMCEEKKSLNVLHDNNNSMKTLQKLINQHEKKQQRLIREHSLCVSDLLSCLSLILMSWSQSFRT